jgi:hypothetical protein
MPSAIRKEIAFAVSEDDKQHAISVRLRRTNMQSSWKLPGLSGI